MCPQGCVRETCPVLRRNCVSFNERSSEWWCWQAMRFCIATALPFTPAKIDEARRTTRIELRTDFDGPTLLTLGERAMATSACFEQVRKGLGESAMAPYWATRWQMVSRAFVHARGVLARLWSGVSLAFVVLLVAVSTSSPANAVVADGFLSGITQNSGSSVGAVALQPYGQVLAGGLFTALDGQKNLVRLHEDGTTDTAFKTAEVDAAVHTIVPLPSGQTVIGGSFATIRSTSQAAGTGTVMRGIARLDADGTLDLSFNPNATANGTQGNVFRVLRLASGKLLVGGHFTAIGGTTRSKLARLNSNGSVDTTFNAGTMNINDYVWNFAETPNGKILVCGGFTRMGNATHINVARLNADGSNDPTFIADTGYIGSGYPSVNTVLPRSDGSVVITGAFDVVNNSVRTNIARLGSDGSPIAFAAYPTPNAPIHWAVQQPDGAIVIGGSFTALNALANYSKLARITAAGAIDSSFVSPVITGGDVYTLLRQPDGRILAGGALAAVDGRTSNYLARIYGAALTPVRDVAQVSVGQYHQCLINTAGKTECWGDHWLSNFSYQLGNRPWVRSDPIPHLVPGLPDGTLAVAPSAWSTCVLTPAHGVSCWGYNMQGQVGDGTTVNRPDPTDVIGLSSGVRSIGEGTWSECAIMDAGSVRCWGYNSTGQLGDGTTTTQPTPVDVQGLGTTVQALTMGSSHTCALTTAGGVLCWGGNFEGQLGNGTNVNSLTPVAVTGLAIGVTSIQATRTSTCALTTAGAVLCWGGGDTANSLVPVTVPALAAGALAIGAGEDHMCAITSTGTVKCWGRNDRGQLGDGTAVSRTQPGDVVGLGSGVRHVRGGHLSTCALTNANALFCWGNDHLLPMEVLRYAFRVTAVADGGGVVSPAGSHLVDAGTQERFTISADTGRHLLGVDGSCGGTLTGNVYTTSVIGGDCTLAAHFALDTFTVTPSVTAGHGSITPATAQTVNYGVAATFTLAPESGYHTTVSGTCGGTLAGHTYTTTAITTNCSVIASFAIDTFTVTPSVSGSHGTIAPSTPQSVAFGSTTGFTLAPDAGYHASVTGSCGGSLVGNVYTTNAITANCAVIASFAIDTFTVTPSVAGSHGTITPSTPQSISFGATTTFTLAPDPSYLANVTGSCGGALAGNTYITLPIHANCTVIASFLHVQASLGIDDARAYVRYGMTVNYLVTLLNNGETSLSGNINNTLPAQLDGPATTWTCVEPGVGVQCTPSGHGPLADSVIVPSGRSVSWLISAPVRIDAQEPTIDNTVTFVSPFLPNPLNAADLDILVLFRNGVDHEYDDGADGEEP